MEIVPSMMQENESMIRLSLPPMEALVTSPREKPSPLTLSPALTEVLRVPIEKPTAPREMPSPPHCHWP